MHRVGAWWGRHSGWLTGALAVVAMAGGFAMLTSSRPPVAQAVQAGEVPVAVIDFAFNPASVTVTPGSTVVWTSAGNAPHDVTANDGSFSSPRRMARGDSFRFTFTAAGSFDYICTIHPNSMRGTVVVGGAATASTPPQAAPAGAAVQPPVQRASSPPSTGAASAPSSRDVTIRGGDYFFDAPDTMAAGISNVTLQNVGQEEHHAQFAKLKSGVTFDQVGAAFQTGSPEAALPLLEFAGGPGAIVPGGRQTVTLDLDAGQYLLLCFISTAEDVPHLALGMVKPLVVVPPSGGQAPQASLTVTGVDFAFQGIPAQVPGGQQTWRFNNAPGAQLHEMIFARVQAGATLAQIQAFLTAAFADPSLFDSDDVQLTSTGGIQAFDAGKGGWVNLNFTPGVYVAVCFVPDTETGIPHAFLGMITPFEVR